MAERLSCCVPFCRRTRPAGEYSEWICAKHWRHVDQRLRWLHRSWTRRLRREPENDEWRFHYDRVWSKCKAEAIERSL